MGVWALVQAIPQFLGLASKGVDAWSAHDQKKMDVSLEKYKVDGKLDETKIAAEVNRINALVDDHKQDTTFGGRLMKYCFVYPLAGWWTAIIVDSIFHQMIGWTWRVGSAPILETWGGWIVAYLFLHSTLIEGNRK